MKKTLIILVFCIVLGYFLWIGFLWKVFKSNIAGSYTHAELWSLKVKERDLINIINEIKREHSELEPPNASYPTSGRNSFWYDFIFYYSDSNENVQAFIRQNEDTLYTTLGLVAITAHIDSLTPAKDIKTIRKEINQDFGYFQNKAEIKKFEKKILKLIKEKLNE